MNKNTLHKVDRGNFAGGRSFTLGRPMRWWERLLPTPHLHAIVSGIDGVMKDPYNNHMAIYRSNMTWFEQFWPFKPYVEEILALEMDCEILHKRWREAEQACAQIASDSQEKAMASMQARHALFQSQAKDRGLRGDYGESHLMAHEGVSVSIRTSINGERFFHDRFDTKPSAKIDQDQVDDAFEAYLGRFWEQYKRLLAG